MAVTYSSNRVTVTTYKSGTSTADSTTDLQITSGEIVSGDIGRFVAVIPSSTNSKFTQIRRITNVVDGVVSINSPWNGTISSGTNWRVSHNLEDVHAIGNAALQKIGDRSYRWNADWNITATGFLADADCSLEMQGGLDPANPISSGGIVQFGVLYGGEGVGVETNNGCRLRFRTIAGNTSLYDVTNSRVENGPVINYYGCIIHSQSNGWMFQRMRGPVRFIGCNFDGIVGGRFYHEGSEWVQCRMTGNNNATTAWSLGATFERPISNIFSYYNIGAMKSFGTYGGTLRNITFSNNTSNFNTEGGPDSVVDFIDSTEIDSSTVIGLNGQIYQYRSVNISTTTANGSALSDVAIRINNKNDTTQGTVQITDANGIAGEILAMRISKLHTFDFTNLFPFRIRLRKYNYIWSSLNVSIADPIKQSVALLENTFVTQDISTAQSHTGISITDHGASPVNWNSKNWGITIVGNRTTNPSLTIDDIKHYLHYNLSQNSSFGGKAIALVWHEVIPMNLYETVSDLYGSITKGVRVVDENGDPFPGVVRMQSDDETYYIAPKSSYILASNMIDGTRVQLYNVTQSTEIDNSVVSGGSGYSYLITSLSGDANEGDELRIRTVYVNGLDCKAPYENSGVFSFDSNLSFIKVQDDCPVYDALGVDGSLVTKFNADYADDEIDLVIATNFTGAELYAWYMYNLTTEQGIRLFWNALTAIDQANFRINIDVVNLYFDNTTTTNVHQTDTRRIFRSDEVYPVKEPTTGGGGIDIVWKNQIFIAETGVSGLTASESTQLMKTLTKNQFLGLK